MTLRRWARSETHHPDCETADPSRTGSNDTWWSQARVLASRWQRVVVSAVPPTSPRGRTWAPVVPNVGAKVTRRADSLHSPQPHPPARPTPDPERAVSGHEPAIIHLARATLVGARGLEPRYLAAVGKRPGASNHHHLIQPRFNLAMRRPVDGGNQWRSQVSARTSAELIIRCTSCSFGLAAERQGTH